MAPWRHAFPLDKKRGAVGAMTVTGSQHHNHRGVVFLISKELERKR